MTAVYASTAPEWLTTIETLPFHTELAFWQPTPKRPKQIAVGERWYFKERGKPWIRGFGLFRSWEALKLTELFRRYGTAAGYPSIEELVAGMQTFRDDTSASTTVGNVALSEFSIFPEPRYLTELGLDDLPVPFRYLSRGDPLAGRTAPPTLAVSSASAEILATSQAANPITISPQVDAPPGPTTGIAPTDWSSSVAHSSSDPAFVYALRFGTYDIWKVGWAVDVKERLRQINSHIPHEVLKAHWSLEFQQSMPSKTRAFEVEQLVLASLAAHRTQGERMNCSQKVFLEAWLSIVRGHRAK